MSEWRLKCTKLSNHILQQADLMLELAQMIRGSAGVIYEDATSLSEDEAREIHLKWASLLDQLDSTIPAVNRIARVARNVRCVKSMTPGETLQESA